MQFHILDENYIPIAVMDNDLPDTIHFQKSKMQRFLTGSADFFDFETSKIHVDSDKFQAGYWIAFKYDARDRLMYINDIQEAEQDKMMSISTLSNNLDLNQENTQPFSADIARPFSWYFDRIMYDTGYEIGINEISNLTRKLSWDSEMSHRAFLQSVATQFDNAELDYEVVLNSDFTIKKRLVHIKKQIGEVRDDIELRYGENIKTVKRSTNIDNLYTAIKPISKDDNGKVTDISSMPDWQKLDENGNVKFFHKKGSQHILAPQANARFGNRSTGGYVVYDYSYDKVSQSDLFNRSVTKLEEISVPAINYEVDGRTGAKIGDTVKIVDDGYTPPLILSARVLEQVFSFDNASVEQSIFGNYKALQSQISADLIAKMQQLAEENAPYKAQTLTTNGLTFKNSEGSTTLTARLYKGNKEIMPESYEWTIDGVAISGNSEQHEITADDINGKAVVRWSAVINGVTVAFDEVTITDVSDGTDGISPTVKINPDTSLTIIDAQGTRTTPVLKGTDGIAGKEGVGVKTTAITYAISTSGTTAPTTGWTSSVPSLVKGQYLWTQTTWTYTDNTSETGYSVSYISKDGNNGTDGVAGKDGVGISNTTIEYVGTVSGTSKPTSGWTTTIPSVAAGQYLWTRTTWQYTDGTSEQGYTNALMGKTGATGPKGDQGVQGLQGPIGTQGIAGPKGADGKTQYTHIAYANSADGVTNFSTSDSNRTYIGMYIDFNIDDSTTPSDYSWTLIKGADGTQGIPGKPGTDGKTPYFHTAWAYSADGTDRFTTVYPNLNLLEGTKDFSGVWSNAENWQNDGTYKGLTVKKKTSKWDGINKIFTASKDGVYTFSAYVKSSGNTANIFRYCGINSTSANAMQRQMGNNFDWIKDTVTFNLKANDNMWVRYEITGAGTDSILWNAGHKWEEGSIATPHMPSASEVTTADYPKYIGQYTNFMQADSTNPSDYTWSLMRGNDGKDGADGKDGIAGKDGKGIKATAITYQASANGTTAPTGTWSASVPTVAKGSFLWTRTIWTYTDNATETGYAVAYMGTNGNNGTNGLAGKDGTGIKTTTITYVGSTSGTTAPTSGWTSTVPTVAAGSYLWTKTVWAYTDNTSETGYSVARMGLKGDKGDPGTPGVKGSDGTSGIIVSSVAPASPKTGQLWQDTSTTPQLVKKWTGSSWVIWELYAQNLKADTLETISAIIGKLNNTYTVDYGTGVHTGTVTIENGMKIVDDTGISRTITDFTSQSSGQGMFARYLPDKSDTAKYQQAWYTPFSLRFDDTINDWHGQITAENVTLVPWTNLTYLSGFTTAENNPCQYRKIKNLDGSYTVQFRGQVKPVSGNFAINTQYNTIRVPVDAQPATNKFGLGIGDFTGTQSARLVSFINDGANKGTIQLRVTGTASAYIAIDNLTYIL